MFDRTSKNALLGGAVEVAAATLDVRALLVHSVAHPCQDAYQEIWIWLPWGAIDWSQWFKVYFSLILFSHISDKWTSCLWKCPLMASSTLISKPEFLPLQYAIFPTWCTKNGHDCKAPSPHNGHFPCIAWDRLHIARDQKSSLTN